MPEGIKRPVVRVCRSQQISLFDEASHPSEPKVDTPSTSSLDIVRFVEPDGRDLRFGTMALDEHLQAMGVKEPLIVQQVLADFDWQAFEADYRPGGRPPYSPRLMTGLIVMGLMQRISSLRDLERFARTNLGALWVSGGIAPDHSSLGRFILRHQDRLAEGLFEQVLQAALTETGTTRESLAGDGTTLEAMSSRFALIKNDADRQQAIATAKSNGTMARHSRGKPPKAVVPAEPEATPLKLKNGRGYRPAYEGTVLANPGRVVVDAELDPSSEGPSMLKMMARWKDNKPVELLLDAGFCRYDILEASVAEDVSLLCPERAEHPSKKAPKYYPLRQFEYDAYSDTYRCPMGQTLTLIRRPKGNVAKGIRPYAQYSTTACGRCAKKADCTRSKQRYIQRSDGQELKEISRQVMAQPGAKKAFAQRKAMVEPVFSVLRERQGLNRFRRRGLAKARVEFRLHLVAYNLSRIVAAAKRAEIAALIRLFRGYLRALASLTANREIVSPVGLTIGYFG